MRNKKYQSIMDNEESLKKSIVEQDEVINNFLDFLEEAEQPTDSELEMLLSNPLY